MIDISDGLGRDAGHIAQLSDVRVMLDAGRIPCRDGVSWRDAVSGGEDYELCFCAAGLAPRELLGVPIHPIGRVEAARAGEPLVVFWDGSARIAGDRMGWEHAT
jgi:thiamine-monophosphate kinase